MKIAVIEWASDDAEAPAVYAGDELTVVRATAVAMYGALAGDDTCDVLDEIGNPHERQTLDDLYEWHRVVREDCTEPWVTFYDLDVDDERVQPDREMNLQLLYPSPAGGAR